MSDASDKLKELHAFATVIRKQTLRDVLEMLPERKSGRNYDSYLDGEAYGHNECLDEIRSRIEKAIGEL